MRHQRAHRKFNRDTSARKALLVGLCKNLIEKEQIKTTLPKAKDLRSVVEKLITKSRIDTVANRRLVASELDNSSEEIVKKLFAVIGPRYKDRPGGYTRVLKCGFRYGDCAPMAIIELVDRDIDAKKARAPKLVAEKATSEEKAEKKVKVAKTLTEKVAKPARAFGAAKGTAAKKEVSVKRRATGK